MLPPLIGRPRMSRSRPQTRHLTAATAALPACPPRPLPRWLPTWRRRRRDSRPGTMRQSRNPRRGGMPVGHPASFSCCWGRMPARGRPFKVSQMVVGHSQSCWGQSARCCILNAISQVWLPVTQLHNVCSGAKWPTPGEGSQTQSGERSALPCWQLALWPRQRACKTGATRFALLDNN